MKYKNPDKSAHILPISGSFHIEMTFMSAIYKRLKESSIEDLLVEADLIAPQVQLFKPYVAIIIIKQQGYISYFMKLYFVYSYAILN